MDIWGGGAQRVCCPPLKLFGVGEGAPPGPLSSYAYAKVSSKLAISGKGGIKELKGIHKVSQKVEALPDGFITLLCNYL